MTAAFIATHGKSDDVQAFIEALDGTRTPPEPATPEELDAILRTVSAGLPTMTEEDYYRSMRS